MLEPRGQPAGGPAVRRAEAERAALPQGHQQLHASTLMEGEQPEQSSGL